MNPPALFAYGTLLQPAWLRRISGSRATAHAVRLNGYARYRLNGRPYPGLRQQPGAHTDGVLYRPLFGAAWRRLDRYESDAVYVKQRVRVVDQHGRVRQALTYAVRPTHYHRLSRQTWEPQHFWQTRRARWWACAQADLPVEVVENARKFT